MALKMTYNVDMCFCIDATGSMGPVINTVKQNALSFYKDVVAVMEKKQKTINSMRVKPRDFLVALINIHFQTLNIEGCIVRAKEL